MKVKLKQIRESKGITQTFIAKKLGYKTVSAYSNIEKGKRKLDLEKALIIADILGVEVEKIVER